MYVSRYRNRKTCISPCGRWVRVISNKFLPCVLTVLSHNKHYIELTNLSSFNPCKTLGGKYYCYLYLGSSRLERSGTGFWPRGSESVSSTAYAILLASSQTVLPWTELGKSQWPFRARSCNIENKRREAWCFSTWPQGSFLSERVTSNDGFYYMVWPSLPVICCSFVV